MKTLILSSFSILLMACGGSHIGETTSNSASSGTSILSPSQKKMIQFLEDEGRLIYEYDYFASIATDLFLENTALEDRNGISGWLVHETQEGTVVSFYRHAGADISVAADVVFNKNQSPLLKIPAERDISKKETIQYSARRVALDAAANECSNSFNTVTIEQMDGTFRVYVLAATINPDEIVVGGHSRVLISSDGATVIDETKFTNSCQVLSSRPEGLPDGATIEGMYVTHVLDDIPTPTHVFLSRLHRMNLYVVTESFIWSVNNGKISLVQRKVD